MAFEATHNIAPTVYPATTREILRQVAAVTERASTSAITSPKAIRRGLENAINARKQCAAWFEESSRSTRSLHCSSRNCLPKPCASPTDVTEEKTGSTRHKNVSKVDSSRCVPFSSILTLTVNSYFLQQLCSLSCK